MSKEKSIFLLRAFGDFVIAIHMASRSKADAIIKLVASKHLEPLYTALSASLPENITIRFHDFKIRNTLMGCFTNKFLFHPHTITELFALRSYIRKNPANGTYYLEQRKRLFLPSLFSNTSFQYIISNQNVYKAYSDFFFVPMQELENIPFEPYKKGVKVLIIPSARQAKRNISTEIIKKIVEAFEPNNAVITVASFKKETISSTNNTVVYNDFCELKNLINNTDLFIGSDSMPVHLAQMLGKPHYILYPKSVKDQFFTPFALKHASHFAFEDIAARKNFLPDE